METFAAVLTAVLFWAFVSYLMLGNRLAAKKKAGQLLLRISNEPSPRLLGQTLFVCIAVAIIIFWANRLFYDVNSDKPIGLSELLVWLFFVPQIGWTAIIIALDSTIECRRHGLVAQQADGPYSFIPWSLIRYCKWISDDGTLLIRTKDLKMQVQVAPKAIEKLCGILVDHVDTRDASGGTINAERLPFAYSDEPEPLHRRRLQFSLNTALLFMVVASAAFAWLGIHLKAGREVQAVLTRLHEFDPEVKQYRGHVQGLDFTDSCKQLGDEQLVDIAACKQLNWLNLSGTQVTDEGLGQLEPLVQLEALVLSGTQITDHALVHIKKLPRLKILDLSATQISDDGLRQLEGLHNLEWIAVSGSKTTDEGVQQLKKKLPDAKIY